MPRKILLADDSITIQKVVELTFSDSDFDVVSVGNGEQALRKAREVRPDIALLDVIMPEKNGYEVCQILKQDPDLRRMPVLLLTGTFESFDRERADQVGADGYLTKPFESQMLISKVEELLATAPRQVTPAASAGRMEIVTEGKIMKVEAPAPEEPPAAEPPAEELSQEAAPEPIEEPPPAPEAEPWPEPLAQGVSFPSSPSAAAHEAKAAFQEWSGAASPAPQAAQAQDDGSDYLPTSFEEEDAGSGPPSTSDAAEEEERAAHAAAPEPPPRPPRPSEPERPLAPDTYEQTFELQAGTEAVSLAAASTPPPPAPSTLYTGPEPAQPASASLPLTQDLVDQIARRVVQQLSEQVIREVAWEVIPDLAELLIKQRIQELEQGAKPHD